MIVLHGVVAADGRVALWAEADDAGLAAPPVAGAGGELALRLPSGRVTVPVVYPPVGVDIEALVRGIDDGRAAPSIGFLADVRAFAADLVVRGRYAPGLAPRATASARGASGASGGGDATVARWRAVLSGVDRDTAEELAHVAPRAALAASGAATAAEDVVRLALDVEVDALVRARLNQPGDEPATAGAATAGAGAATAGAATAGAGAGAAGAVGAWLRALSGPDGAFDAAPAQVERLRHTLDRWLASGDTARVRLCFRLTDLDEDPRTGAHGGWLLDFLLQAVDEPSLLVPADDVWADRVTPLLRFTERDPREILLEDLGRASRLYPALDQALRVAQPTAQDLDTEAAHGFLTHAELLAEAGFGVLLPSWWQQRMPVGLGLTVSTRHTTTHVLRDRTVDRDAIVDYRWEISLGGEILSRGELNELAQAKIPLVRWRGRWVHLDPQRLRAGLAFLARGGEGQLTTGAALRILHDDRDRPLPVTDVEGEGWVADLLTGRAPLAIEPVTPPSTLAATLRPYQRRGLAWLSFMDSIGIGALLADDMGLGKTVQLLALEAATRADGPRPPTLIVCPLSVLGNWQREIERFTPSLTVRVHHGAQRTLDLAGVDLVLTTYQIATRDADVLAEVAWDRVVLDEAQHIKNSASATAQAIRRFPARHRVALTGTPVENRLDELWSIMDFLNPGVLGPVSTFRARFAVPVERYGDDGAARRLRTLIQPYVLRRLKSDASIISDLPEKLERTVWCAMTVEQASLYRAVTEEMFIKLREGRAGPARKGIILSALTKLKQACNHPAHLLADGSPLPGRSGKLDRLEEILANVVADGEKALVFTQFARFGTMLRPFLAARLGVEVEFLHGGTPKGARDALVARFQSAGGPPVLLVSLKAGGTGLNLTAATHVVHIDRWWNPASEAQATDRAHRIGQRHDVQVHTFITLGTIEERVQQMLHDKRAVARAAVGHGEGWLASLSTGDLAGLVELE